MAKRYFRELSSCDAATAMQAARLNAKDLVDTAKLLFKAERYAHSTAYSILAIEEAGKKQILFAIFLDVVGDRQKAWKEYWQHRAKTEPLNLAIESRVRATFPSLGRSAAKEIGAMGPTPDELEDQKQRAVYSDCLDEAGKLAAHLPRNVDWRKPAWDRLCEAEALVAALRDHSPKELDIWLRYARKAKAVGVPLSSVLKPLHDELLAEGFVKAGWWDTILSDGELGRGE